MKNFLNIIDRYSRSISMTIFVLMFGMVIFAMGKDLKTNEKTTPIVETQQEEQTETGGFIPFYLPTF